MPRAIQSVAILGLLLASTGCAYEINYTVKNNPEGGLVTFEIFDETDPNNEVPTHTDYVTDTGYHREEIDRPSVPYRVCVFLGDDFVVEEEFEGEAGATYDIQYDVGKNQVSVTRVKQGGSAANSTAGAAAKVGAAAKQTPAEAVQIFVQYIEAHVQSEADVMDLFGQLDTSGDGSLSIAEVKAANKANGLGIKGKNVKQGVTLLDGQYGDGDGELQIEELIAAYVDLVVNQ